MYKTHLGIRSALVGWANLVAPPPIYLPPSGGIFIFRSFIIPWHRVGINRRPPTLGRFK